jgi:formylmethanofuran dehydrogenase subunit C
MGWESDTNKFKIGDGTNHWANLDYFADINSTVNPAFGSSIVFEGATADSYETTLQVTDPTADRTITLPNASGTVITTGNLSDITDIGVFTGSITMEGTTADSFEYHIAAGDPTADRTATFPDASGTIVLDTATQTLQNKTLVTATISQLTLSDGSFVIEGATSNDFETTVQVVDPTADRVITIPDTTGTIITTGNLSDITSVGVLNSSVVFEGTTADDHELTLAAGEPTADRTVSFPDASGTVVVDSAIQTLSNKTLTSPHVSGLSITDGAITLEGATPNEHETTISIIDPTADRTITIPDITGTVITSGDTGTVTSTMILDGTIVDGDINASAAIALSKLATDPLARSNHTGSQTASTISDFDTQVRTSKVTDLTAPTSSFSMNSQKITNLGTPTDSTDAATKAYVDAVTEGLHIHPSVVAATTANITLASDVENGDTLDGVTLSTGDRILVKNQSTASENGIYVVAASGAPSRATDFDTPAEIDGGDFVFVTGGTANDNTGWVQTNTVGTVGTDAIAFSQFSGAGTYTAGNGLTLTGTSFSINTGVTVDLSTAQTLTNKTLTSPKVNLGINAQTGTSYTFVLDDAGKLVTANNASAITVTIPPASSVAYPVGTQLNIVQKGAGQVTFAQGSGVTINSTGATATAPKLRVRYSSATAVYEGSDVWYVLGDIA